MKRMVLAAIAATVMLGACSEDQARPDSYWNNHPEQAKAQRKQCGENVEIMQAIKTTPPDALTAKERECLFLVRQWEPEDKYELKSAFD